MKVGDIVICINNRDIVSIGKKPNDELTIGKSYKIIEVNHSSCGIINDNNQVYGYYRYRFIELKKLRKQKLDKINRTR